MPAPETVELRERTGEQLGEDLEDAHQSLFNLRFQAATRQLADVAQVRNAKRRIARIKTLLREREIIATADRLAQGEPQDEPEAPGESHEPAVAAADQATDAEADDDEVAEVADDADDADDSADADDTADAETEE